MKKTVIITLSMLLCQLKTMKIECMECAEDVQEVMSIDTQAEFNQGFMHLKQRFAQRDVGFYEEMYQAWSIDGYKKYPMQRVIGLSYAEQCMVILQQAIKLDGQMHTILSVNIQKLKNIAQQGQLGIPPEMYKIALQKFDLFIKKVQEKIKKKEKALELIEKMQSFTWPFLNDLYELKHATESVMPSLANSCDDLPTDALQEITRQIVSNNFKLLKLAEVAHENYEMSLKDTK